MCHPPKSFCAGFYYYQGSAKNAREMQPFGKLRAGWQQTASSRQRAEENFELRIADCGFEMDEVTVFPAAA
jgi:hypothetical protein